MPYVIAFHHKGPAFCVNKSLDYLLKKKKKKVCISAITSYAYDTHSYRGKLVAHLVIHNIKWSAHIAV